MEYLVLATLSYLPPPVLATPAENLLGLCTATMHLTETTAARNEVALSYHIVCTGYIFW